MIEYYKKRVPDGRFWIRFTMPWFRLSLPLFRRNLKNKKHEQINIG